MKTSITMRPLVLCGVALLALLLACRGAGTLSIADYFERLEVLDEEFDQRNDDLAARFDGQAAPTPAGAALVPGLGWFATQHSVGVYSAQRPSGEGQRTDPQADQAALDAMDSPPQAPEPAGDATVEAYSVAFGREGEPEQCIVIGRLAGGERFIANTPADRELMWSMTREEFVGQKGSVNHDSVTGRNVFEPA